MQVPNFDLVSTLRSLRRRIWLSNFIAIRNIFVGLYIFSTMINAFYKCYRGANKLEEACDLYVRAGNAFKMAKKWSGRTHYILLN